MNLLLGALNPIALRLGALEIHWYGVIIATGVVLAVGLALQEAKRRNVSEDDILNLILWALPFALIGARLYYVVFEWSYCRRHALSPWLVLDIAAPTVMIAQAIGRWGNFMNQEAYGAPTTLHFLQSLHLPDWVIQQMLIDGAYRQPTFLYESAWNVLGFIIIMSIRHRTGWFKQGEILFSYLIWYSFGRFFIEGMRTDSLFIGPLRVSQIVSLVLFFGAIGLWIWRRKHSQLPDYLTGNQAKEQK